MDKTAPARTKSSALGEQAGADLEAGRQVLKTEAEALGLAAKLLDASFSKAIDLLLDTKGRVIVSGQGKAGHVGGKIAATLASTGTPAHFVHPSEASHGDLGMVTSADSLLMLSNSGETKELVDLVLHAKRFHIPLLAITGREDSALARQADLVLLLPKAPEACPMGLSPTTSSTLMLALGDALAVALMGRRGFNHDDYRVLHPAGSIGQALIKVGDIMRTGDELPVVGPDTKMSDVIKEMSDKGHGFTSVIDGSGRLVGIITDGDLRRNMIKPDFLERLARDVMTASPKTIGAGAVVGEALHQMNLGGERRILCLIVTEGNRAIGFVEMHDCLRAGVR